MVFGVPSLITARSAGRKLEAGAALGAQEAADVLRAAVARGNGCGACDRAAVPIEIVQPCSLLGSGCRAAALASARTVSQELTTATASISIMKSGPARRVTPTVVLVGVATPR